MAQGRIFLGTRRYSSWSLRGWLAVKWAGLDVEEIVIPLAGGSTPAVKAASPSGFVPYLEHDGNTIWDSLAIGEYCAELAPQLWPSSRADRAHARSVAAEMHSGFRELRIAMPMSLFRQGRGAGRSEAVLADIARIEQVWAETLDRFGGPYLNGAAPGIMDAMYAPVAFRFMTYAPDLSARSEAYCAAIRAERFAQAWKDAAEHEPQAWRIARFEEPASV
jgi:glutathione S-transferase